MMLETFYEKNQIIINNNKKIINKMMMNQILTLYNNLIIEFLLMINQINFHIKKLLIKL